jgi:hypothetical protein
MNFAKVATTNARSPLGIIGLFVTLVYAIAGLALSYIILELSFCLQIILIAFIVLYPCVLLAVFYWLLTRHHRKLYAPFEFKDEGNFLKHSGTNTAETIVDDYSPDLKDEMISQDNQKSIDAVKKVLGTVLLAEEFAFKYYSEIYGADNIQRGCGAKNAISDRDFTVRRGRNRIHISVKLISRKSPLERIAQFAEKAHELWGADSLNYRREFILCTVVDESDDQKESVKQRLEAVIQEHSYRFKYEMLSFKSLAEKYGYGK